MNPSSPLRRLPLAAALLALPILAQAQSLSATGAASPSTNLRPGDWVLVTVNTSRAANPASTGITVQADLSGFLRSTAQDLNDAGQYGDAVAGDGIFTYRENIASAATLGAKTITATVRDAQGRSATTTFNATLGASAAGGATTTPVAVPLSVAGSASPTVVSPGGVTLVTARVTAASNPVSTGIGVTANLSALGGSRSQRLRDNGLNGDAVAGDGIYSFRQTVGGGTRAGVTSVRILANDGQGRSASSSTSVTVGTAEVSVSPFGAAAASPSSLLAGESSLLTVRVTAGTGPASTGLTVTSDLSSLGLGVSQAFNDAGQNGDAVAGDGTYSVRATVPAGTSAGTRTLSARIADAQGRSGTAGFTLAVNAAPTPPPPTPMPTAPAAGAPQACANFYTAGFALPQGQLVSTVPALGKPVKGTSYRDPVHGTCGIRVTDHANEAPSSFARHDYSRRQAFNADNSYLVVQAMNGFWHLYNANTMAFIRTLTGPAGNTELQWHPTDPKSLYFFNGGLTIRQLNVDTNTATVAADFTGKLPWADVALAWTKGEGAPSADGRYWCLMAETSSFITRGVFVYDMQTRTVVGTRSLSARPDHTSMSASGRWCVVSHLAGSGGTVAWDRSFTTSRQLHTTSEHSDLALNAAGQDVYVAVDYQANAGDFFMVNIDTNTRTNLFPTYLAGTATAYHVSGQAFAKPGWVLVSTYASGSPNQWLHNKMFAVELKSGGRILNIGHHQSRFNGYWTEPQASVSRDFTRVIWASNFGTASDTDLDAYMMYLPPGLIPAAQ